MNRGFLYYNNLLYGSGSDQDQSAYLAVFNFSNRNTVGTYYSCLPLPMVN